MKARWRSLSLRARLVASAVAVIVALTLVYSLLIFARVRQAHDAEIEKRGAALAEQLAGQAEFPLRAGDTVTLRTIADQTLGRGEVLTVEIEDRGSGRMVRAAAQAAGPVRSIVCAHNVVPRGFADEVEALEGGAGRPQPPIGRVRLTLSLAESDRVLRQTLAAVSLSALILVALAILINVQIARRVTDPLARLAEGARRIGAGQFDARVDESAGGEIGAVAGQFNRMAENLKRNLDQLIQQEKMASLGRLSAGITHEIGNPLNSMLIDLGLVLCDLPEGPDRDRVLGIQQQARRLKQIVTNLLDYARTPTAEMQAVDLNAALDDALRVLAHPVSRAQLMIVRRLPPGLTPARAIKTMCVQVFVNVIANAVEAAGKGGRLEIDGAANGDSIRLGFTDSGPGVPEERMEAIFEPFVTSKDSGQGTGLGLSISRQIMTGLGGGIRAERDGDGRFQIIVEFKAVS